MCSCYCCHFILHPRTVHEDSYILTSVSLLYLPRFSDSYDRTLGGLEMTMRLQKHLAKVFTQNKKTKEDVYASPRAMAKLLKESERVKEDPERQRRDDGAGGGACWMRRISDTW